jgi:hypothetical protein
MKYDAHKVDPVPIPSDPIPSVKEYFLKSIFSTALGVISNTHLASLPSFSLLLAFDLTHLTTGTGR